MSKLSIRERMLKEMNNELEFMNGREKGDQSLNTETTIIDYGYLNAEDGEFICYLTKESDSEFFFGGSVLTEKFKKLEMMFTEEEIQEALKDGIEVIFEQKKSKNRRNYIDVKFI